MIHSVIQVRDEARSVDFRRIAFALDVADRLEFEGFTLLYLSNRRNGFELELSVNASRTEGYGDGYGRLAVSVDDPDAERARLEAAGLRPTVIRQLEHAASGTKARFFMLQDPESYRIEIVQRGGRYL